MAKPSRKPAEAPETTPDVERHDEVYFRHASGPRAGRVLSRGAHGCVIDADGERHKVRWEHFLGHKVRVRPDVKVVDKGEDGFLVEDGAGARRFVRDPIGVVDPQPMRKAIAPAVLFLADPAELAKAVAPGEPIAKPIVSAFDMALHQAAERISAAAVG